MRSLLLGSGLLILLLAPLATAEFGPESAAGWPVGADGREIVPPYPAITTILPAGPVNKAGPVTAYPYYPALTAEVQRLAADHPDLVKLSSAGKSSLGLDEWLLEIANFKDPNMIPLEDREVVYVDGGTHSNEYSGVYFNTELAQFLLDEYKTNATAKWIVDHRHTYILPLVNPDGSNAFGRLNAKAVNVNRNYPALWGKVNEDPVMNNKGPSPASEIETRNIMALLDKLHPDYYNSIHCCGNLWLHPWGVESEPLAPDFQMFTRICDEVFKDVRKQCGPIWSTIYPASGSSVDQAYMQTGASAWSYEMSGRGAVAPWGQPVIVDSVRVQERESWNGILHAMLNVDKYGARPRIVAVTGDASTLHVTIQNVGYGNLTAGNLTVAGATLALPRLAPDATATMDVPGAFAAGAATPMTLGFTKREMLAPQGHTKLDVPLVAKDGKLVGVLDAAEPIVPLSTNGKTNVPAPALPLALAALACFALVLRRRT